MFWKTFHESNVRGGGWGGEGRILLLWEIVNFKFGEEESELELDRKTERMTIANAIAIATNVIELGGGG